MYALIQNCAEQGRTGVRTPASFHAAFTLFHSAHQILRRQRRAAHLAQGEHAFKLLLAGYATDWALGTQPLVRLAAQMVHICERLLCTIERQRCFNRSCVQWWASLQGRHRTYVRPLKVNHLGHNKLVRLLSPVQIIYFQQGIRRILTQVGDLLHWTLQLTANALKLSAALMDLSLSLVSSPELKRDAVQELYLNVHALMERLDQDEEALQRALAKHRSLIERLLTLYGSQISYTQLSGAVDLSLNQSVRAYRRFKDVAQLSEEQAKNGLFALMCNVWGSAPGWLLPRRMLQEKMNQRIPRRRHGYHPNHHAACKS
jgi:hypothetical protein